MRSFLLAPLFLLTLAVGAFADEEAEKIPLSDLSVWLNELKTAKGSFTQINPDESISTGSIYIHRPGRIRFEYNAPDKALVMAGASTVAVFDGKSNQPPQQYPLKKTPLSVILARNVNLEQDNMITAHFADEVSTTVIAQDPERPEIGFIELKFTSDPIELRQWIITDEGGNATTVILGEMEFGLELNNNLFSIVYEMDKLGFSQ